MGTMERMLPAVHRLADWVQSRYRELDRDDLVQEGSLGMYDAWTRFVPEYGCSEYTYTSQRALGAMRDLVRKFVKRQRREVLSEDIDYRFVDDRDGRSVESREHLVRFRRFLNHAWADLEGGDREVIEDRYLMGLTLRECADIYGMSPATVLRRERRALANLRSMYEKSSTSEG